VTGHELGAGKQRRALGVIKDDQQMFATSEEAHREFHKGRRVKAREKGM
jgi:hypothetical protein